jgi:rubrerythrin
MVDHMEFLKKIKADLPGEINGIKEYLSLAKSADEADRDCWEAMLVQMAWEEHTHAKHMMHMLDKGGVSYAEYVQAFADAEKMLREYK